MSKLELRAFFQYTDTMRNLTEPQLAKWPFFLGDVLLLGAGYFIVSQSKLGMGVWQMTFVVLCVAGGAWLAIMPFLFEYHLAMKLAEARALTTVVSQVETLEAIATEIRQATGKWHSVQESADKTSGAAKEIADRMTAEVQAFTDFMQRANDGEKATLRLEAEKLRRMEAEWLQVVVRLLDHVFALRAGAQRSGQAKLIEQVGNFQNACHDAARRVGLTPFIANDSDKFDAERHQLIEGDAKTANGAAVGETIATGYTFKGNMLRPALVRLRKEEPTSGVDQSQLALEREGA
jgi:molecular chaperone GrpE (heat shock protein)